MNMHKTVDGGLLEGVHAYRAMFERLDAGRAEDAPSNISEHEKTRNFLMRVFGVDPFGESGE